MKMISECPRQQDFCLDLSTALDPGFFYPAAQKKPCSSSSPKPIRTMADRRRRQSPSPPAQSGTPIPIQPKPANGKTTPTASGQTIAPRRQRAGPLVFVNTSDLNTDSEKQGNRKMVKKWAMLNRNARHLNPSNSKAKAQFLSWDLKGDSQSSAGSSASSASSTPSPIAVIPRKMSDEKLRIAVQRQMQQSAVDRTAYKVLSPFSNLPIEADIHVKNHIEWFLKGGKGDIEVPTDRLVTVNRLAFPMIAQSPAAFCTLIATLESNPYSPVRSGQQSYRNHYLSMALTHTNTLIQRMDSSPSDEVFLCVCFLMWLAEHSGDPRALQVHFNGIAALMCRHWDIFCRTPYFRNGPFFWTFTFNEGSILPDAAEPPHSVRPAPGLLDDTDFAWLADMGLISDTLVQFLPDLVALAALVPREGSRQMSIGTAKNILSYIWYNARIISSLDQTPASPLEDCVRHAATIFYYASVFKDPVNGVGWLAAIMQEHLTHMNLSDMLAQYPHVLLWFTLSAGPFAQEKARDWWLDLLLSARSATRTPTFEEASLALEHRLLWTRGLDAEAKRLWDESTGIMNGFNLD